MAIIAITIPPLQNLETAFDIASARQERLSHVISDAITFPLEKTLSSFPPSSTLPTGYYPLSNSVSQKASTIVVVRLLHNLSNVSMARRQFLIYIIRAHPLPSVSAISAAVVMGEC